MKPRTFAVLLAALLSLMLGACAATPAGGPGSDCDTCAAEELAPVGAPGAATSGAGAKTGQTASNQPNQSDPGARGIITPISRGAGNQEVGIETADERSQAGAPSVNQGLVFPANALATSKVVAPDPLVALLSKTAETYRAALERELRQPGGGDLSRISHYTDELAKVGQQMKAARLIEAASIASAPTRAGDTYNFQGARIVQSVANGSSSGDRAPIDAATARAVGENLADGVRETMQADGEAVELLKAATEQEEAQAARAKAEGDALAARAAELRARANAALEADAARRAELERAKADAVPPTGALPPLADDVPPAPPIPAPTAEGESK